MEHQKILNLLNELGDSKFGTRKWKIVNDQPKQDYAIGNEIIYSTEVLKSNLRDFIDAYILAVGDITILRRNAEIKWRLKIVHHLVSVSQKLME